MATFTHSQLEELWLTAGGLPQWADTAAAIAQAESQGCQYAKAGPTDDRPVKQCTYRHTTTENSYGLWQINRRAHPTYSAATLYTPIGNADAAVAIAKHGNDFAPWTTYTDGAYKTYLHNPGSTTTQAGTNTDPAVGPAAAQGHRGWVDLRNTVNTHLVTQESRSQALRLATLRTLATLSKVKH